MKTKEEQREKIRQETVGSVSMIKPQKKEYSKKGKRKSLRGSFLKHVKSLYG